MGIGGNWLRAAVCSVVVLGCGKNEPAPPAAPVIPVVPAIPAAGGGAGAAPSGAPAAAPSGESSVVTPAPTAATGCPATDATNFILPGTVHGGFVNTVETWTLAGSPHRLPNGVNIQENGSVTLEPCARVIVGDGQTVYVSDGGTLIANGQADHPILFDSSATVPSRGLWAGIHFAQHARPNSMLHYVNVEEAGSDTGLPAAIWVDDEFALDVQHVRVVRSKRDGIMLAGPARFAPGSVDLVVTESGIAEELSVPVHFAQANSVGSLPEGTYTGNVLDEILVDSPWVQATATWRNPGQGARYRLQEGLVVGGPTGAVLTIAPGTTLAFAQSKSLNVATEADGAIVLDGGSDATRIVLTSARPTPDAGDWGGIWIARNASRAATKIDYVTIEFAGFADGLDAVGCGDDTPAAIAIEERDLGPRIAHLRLANMPETSIGIARAFNADEATDYTAASFGNDFGGLRCRQSRNRGADASCPDPVPPCR